MIFDSLSLMEKIYIVSSALTGIGSMGLALLVYLKNRSNKLNQHYSLLGFVVAGWSISLFLCHTTTETSLSLMYNKILHVFSIWIPVTFFHFTIVLLDIGKQKRIFLKTGYTIAVVLSLLGFFTSLLVKSLEPKYSFRVWPVPGKLYEFYLAYFSFYSFYPLWLIFKSWKQSTGIQKARLKFIFTGLAFALICGSTNFAYFYNIPIPPVGNFFVFLYVIIFAYAILRYHLMDITIAVTRAGIFFVVYAFVLGIPFWIDLRNGGIQLSTVVAVLLATAGPFIYLYLQKQAESRLLAEQHQYQFILRQAAAGMGMVRDLNRLCGLVVHILTKTVRIQNATLLLRSKETGKYEVQSSRGLAVKGFTLEASSALVRHLKETGQVLQAEEIKQRGLPLEDVDQIASVVNALKAELLVPCMVQEDLIAVIALGKKTSGTVYTPDDLIVFSILAYQSALAIENCLYWEEAKKRLEEEGVRERISSLDAMASSMAHEIDNPIQGIVGHLDLIKDDLSEIELDDELRERIHRSAGFVSEGVYRISDMIKAILEYSRKGTGQMMPLPVYDVLKGFNNLIGPQMKQSKTKFVQEVEEDLPIILGNKIQMEEVLMNFAINAMYAVQNNEEKRVTFKVFKKDDKTIRMEFSDNGSGIETHMLQDIFLVSVTTKGSAEGTGLGLYRSRKIVDLHDGRIWAESEGKGKGATFIVELPVFTGQKHELTEEESGLF